MKIHRPKNSGIGFRSTRAYTLVEALVAGVVLMIGVSAASQLTLTLITQDETSQRTATAYNYQECVANLYRLGLSDAEIGQVMPADPVIDALSFSHGTETAVHTPTLASVPDFSIPYADITIQFHPSPATQSWTGLIWTSGSKDASRTLTLRAFKSGRSSTVN